MKKMKGHKFPILHDNLNPTEEEDDEEEDPSISLSLVHQWYKNTHGTQLINCSHSSTAIGPQLAYIYIYSLKPASVANSESVGGE